MATGKTSTFVPAISREYRNERWTVPPFFKATGKSFVGRELGGKSMTVSRIEKEARSFVARDPKT
jgi:hypothetical protein